MSYRFTVKGELESVDNFRRMTLKLISEENSDLELKGIMVKISSLLCLRSISLVSGYGSTVEFEV